QFLGHRLRQSDQSGLARGVVRLALVSHQADDARDVHDAPPAALHHAAARGPDGEKRRAEVGVEDRVPILVLEAQHQVVFRDSRVVHENVDRAELLLDVLDELQHVGGNRHVAREAAGVLELRGHRVRLRLVAAHDGYLRAAGGERAGDGAADAARAPRHEGALSRQINLHCDTRSRRAFTSATVPQVMAGLFGARRLSSPVSTLPGPISTKSAPGCAAAIAWTTWTQRTGLVSWESRSARASAGAVTGRADTF